MAEKKKRPFKDWRERAKEKGRPANMETFFNEEIAKRDWLEYISPSLTVSVERRLGDRMLLATKGKDPEPNEMEVLKGLAAYHVVEPYKSKLEEIQDNYKQLEVILREIKRRIYLVVDVDAGKRYVCDSPIFPYGEDN